MTQWRGRIFSLCMSNLMGIGQSVADLEHFFEIQYGGRPPSWIPNNTNFEVDLRTAVSSACVCQISWQLVNPLPNYAIFSKSNMAVGRHLGYTIMQILSKPLGLAYCFASPCVKFRENRSIRCRIRAFFQNPIWRPVAILDSWNVRFLSVSPEQDAILR
jgi:hypothetical protein